MSEFDVFGIVGDAHRHLESGFSAAIEDLLVQAASILGPDAARGPARRAVVRRLIRALEQPMSAQQRQRMLSLLGNAFAAGREYDRAAGCFEDALGLALDRDDRAATPEIAFALGQEHAARQHFGEAVSALEVCIVTLTAEDGGEDDAALALNARVVDAMLALTTCEYVRGQFDSAERWLDRADALIPRLPDSLTAAGSAAATRALLTRARCKPEAALRHALVALDIAEQSHNAGLRWARALAVEAALDLVERLTGGAAGTAGRSLLALARAYVDHPRVPRPHAHRREAAMSLTDGVAYLAGVRYLRLAGEASASVRLTALEHLISHAERLHHQALLGLALTALGDDLAARDAQTPALRAYELALKAIEGQDMAAIGLRARRALLRHQEGNSDD
ncbi:MAG TPA: hypothetical protein VF116_15565 [Ktedonobacterales bacterium]